MGTALTSPYWQLRLGADGETVSGLEELAQSLRIILTTPLQSVPLDPEFGCDTLAYVDQPTPQAIPALIREITRAVARCEPRVDLKSVQVVAWDQPSSRTLRLVWRPLDGIEDQQTEIPIGTPVVISPVEDLPVPSTLFEYFAPGFVEDNYVADCNIGDLVP